jgi:hypothetical protein
MFIQRDSLLSSLQLKLISAHQGEIQYARALLMKVFGSGENDIGQKTPSHTLWLVDGRQGFAFSSA